MSGQNEQQQQKQQVDHTSNIAEVVRCLTPLSWISSHPFRLPPAKIRKT